jgi:hypothetical protein
MSVRHPHYALPSSYVVRKAESQAYFLVTVRLALSVTARREPYGLPIFTGQTY